MPRAGWQALNNAAPNSEMTGATGLNRLLEVIDHPLFWSPTHLEDTPALDAVPLIFWLTQELTPASVHTQGPDSSVAHLAFCQAAAQLGLDMPVSHTGDLDDRFAEARAPYGPLPQTKPEAADIVAASLPETGAPSLASLTDMVAEDGALLLYGPGLTDAILADVPATDMHPLVFGAAEPQVALLLGAGAPAPLSELVAMPPDSAERRIISQFVTRMGQLNRAALGAGQSAPTPTRHAEDVERLLAKMIEMEEDRITLRRNRPAETPKPSADMTEALVALQDKLHEREAELAKERQRAQDSARKVQAIRASTSWRITAPLRAIVRLLRGQSRG